MRQGRAATREREEPSSSSSDENGGAGNSSSSQKVKALFTHLRKIANHPLLVRDRYGDQELAFVADVCHRRGVFGHEAGLEKVRKHLEGMSDFDLHELCEDERVRGALDSKRLPPEALEDAGKTRGCSACCARSSAGPGPSSSRSGRSCSTSSSGF